MARRPRPAARAAWLPLLLVLAWAPAGCGPSAPSVSGSGAGSEAGSGIAEAAEIRVEVTAIAVDSSANAPVLILEEVDGPRRLPIWIGLAEAHSIASRLQQDRPPRPNTHDLAKRLLDQLDGRVERVVVTELRDGVYYALIHLDREGQSLAVDSRPSDAVAIALRAGAPLFVMEPVFESGADVILEEEEDSLQPAPDRQEEPLSL